MRSLMHQKKEEFSSQFSGSPLPTMTRTDIATSFGGNPCKGKNTFCIKFSIVLSASNASLASDEQLVV